MIIPDDQFKVWFGNCLKDRGICLIGYFLPGGYCCLQAIAVDRAVHEGIIIPYILASNLLCIGGTINRVRIRHNYKIAGDNFQNCMDYVHSPKHTTIQEYNDSTLRLNFNRLV